MPPRRDRTNFAILLTILAASLALSGLVAVLTVLPAQQLVQTLSEQGVIAQRQLTTAAARQAEAAFNSLANDLLSLIQKPDVQSTTQSSRPGALRAFAMLGSVRGNVIHSIVRVDADGVPMYGWPDAVNQTVVRGERLDWSINDDLINQIIARGGVQFVRRATANFQKFVYLMVSPVQVGLNLTEALVFELDLSTYFQDAFKALPASENTQIWVVAPQVPVLVVYQRKAEMPWATDGLDELTERLFINRDYYYKPGAPSAERDTAALPIFSAFTQRQGDSPSLIVVTNRLVAEGQAEIFATRNRLFVFGLVVVALISLAAVAVARLITSNMDRRRVEEQRRTTARTLLEISRALNSSLDLTTVLNRILEKLADLLPYDSASVALLDDDADEPSLHIAALAGNSSFDLKPVLLAHLRGANEAVSTGKPVIINDVRADPRWNVTPGHDQITAWMGVPLRIRAQTVGVLNINSLTVGRFKPQDSELAEAFADQACVAIENARAHETMKHQFESELETARAIQTSLLPSEVPPVPNIEIAAQSLPARHVSGDYYQYIVLPDGKLGIAVGDVSGKGIPAALLMAVITTALREEILRHPLPADLLNALNADLLVRMQQNHMNSALTVALFDPHTRALEIANGGMIQPYLRTENGWEFVQIGGYPLGASARSVYQGTCLAFVPGTLLLFISDGVVEAQNHTGEMFGFERLEALLNSLPATVSSQQLVTVIFAAVKQYLNGIEAQDDITVVALRAS